MVDTLTESFCERCGTRYTFEPPQQRAGALSTVRVLGKGLRKLALTRAASLDEAISSAKADDERAAVARQVDAFHGAFHFCLACRQYTCSDCWNETAGICLTCEPTPESQAAAALETALTAAAAAAAARPAEHPAAPATPEGPRPEWPAEDRRPHIPASAAEPEPVAERIDAVAPVREAEARMAVGEAEPAVDPDAEALLNTFQPGTSLDDAIAAYEAAVTSARQAAGSPAPVRAVTPAPTPAPVAGPEPEPEPEPIVSSTHEAGVAAPVPVPVPVAGPEPELIVSSTHEAGVAAPAPAEAEAAAPAPSVHEQVAAPTPYLDAVRPAAAAAPNDEPLAIPHAPAGEDPRFGAWRIVAPEIAAAAPSAASQQPPAQAFSAAGFAARMSGVTPAAAPAHQPPSGAAHAGAAAAGRVQPPGGANACVNCGLSLSANARFCRKCGTRQS